MFSSLFITPPPQKGGKGYCFEVCSLVTVEKPFDLTVAKKTQILEGLPPEYFVLQIGSLIDGVVISVCIGYPEENEYSAMGTNALFLPCCGSD